MLHRAKACVSLLAIALLSMVGCTEPEPANPNFPQMKGGPVGLESYILGELVSENGCLRLRDDTVGKAYLIIWPNFSKMTSDGQGVRLSENSEVLLSVGDKVMISGGTGSDRVHNSDCPGPYWLFGRQIGIYPRVRGHNTPTGKNPIPAGASQQMSCYAEQQRVLRWSHPECAGAPRHAVASRVARIQ